MKKPDLTPYPQIARDFLRRERVYRIHMKSVADMDGEKLIRACHDWYTEHGLEQAYRAFEKEQLIRLGEWEESHDVSEPHELS